MGNLKNKPITKMEKVRQLWNQAKFGSSFTPPKTLQAVDGNGERYIVINDNSTIYRLMNGRGQVFMVAHFRCVPDENNQYYTCNGPMHIISCTNYSTEEDQYANDVIKPIFFGN